LKWPSLRRLLTKLRCFLPVVGINSTTAALFWRGGAQGVPRWM
jgi:hypothetical protein